MLQQGFSAARGLMQRRSISSSRTYSSSIGRDAAEEPEARLGGNISRVQVGTQFELWTLNALQHSFAGLALRRVGGANDGGVDLRGSWILPLSASASRPSHHPHQACPIIVQCKAMQDRVGPGAVRDLLGVLANEIDAVSAAASSPRPSSRSLPPIGILVSSRGFTPQAFKAASHGLLCLATVQPLLSSPSPSQQESQPTTTAASTSTTTAAAASKAICTSFWISPQAARSEFLRQLLVVGGGKDGAVRMMLRP